VAKSAGQPEVQEKRTLPRWRVSFPVLHGEGATMLVGLAADLNEQGMAFVTRKSYAVDSVLSLELRIPSGRMQLRGLVRHCQTGKAGVQFVGLSAEQRSALAELCAGQGCH
jgi:hypothetical protein